MKCVGINMGQIIGAHEFKSSHYVLPNTKIPVPLGLKKKGIFGTKIIAFSKGKILAEFLN